MSEQIKKSFVVHSEWFESINDLTGDQVKALFNAFNEYTITGVMPKIEDPLVKILFKSFKPRIDSDVGSYQASCKRKSEAMKKIWEEREAKKKMEQHSTVDVPCNSIEQQEHYSVANDTDSDSDSDSDSDTDTDSDSDILFKKEKNIKKEKPKPKRFVPPTLDEVKAYCQERNNNVIPEKFIDYYESNGWKVGRNPMKDWKACVRTWEGNCYNKAPPKKSNSEKIDEYLLSIINGEDNDKTGTQ